MQQLADLHLPSGTAGSPPAAEPHSAQLLSACNMMGKCCLLVAKLMRPLSRQEAARFCSALGLVMRSGPGMLTVEPGRFLATFSRGFNPGLGPRQAHIVAQALYQLGVVCDVLPLAASTAGQREVVAAFARTSGRPQLVLPWLLSISQALLDLPLGSFFNAPQTTGKCWEGC